MRLSVPPLSVAVGGGGRRGSGDRVSPDSFLKDGRKICIGDCALFKPPHDSPPFIGLIHRITSKEDDLQLGVNWLYRPADVKLCKDIFLSEPNEVFYSFHGDVIPAASLLHPCKVAFLPKDVKLPARVSSFVCRRVFDIANKRLWWLTDPNYFDEHQEEVNNLLEKTRKEMHARVCSDGHSPKCINGPKSTSELRSGSDHVKGKKRDRKAETIRRESFLKADKGESCLSAENIQKVDIASITKKGGLMDFENVKKLVKLMQPDRVEKQIDLSSRSILVGVIAATEKYDCLCQFVHLRGLPLLDEWLQDVHKGNIECVSSSEYGEKSVEEFLLVLLRALDKLPVNLDALQTCNIGRSVNTLRTHKNLEIQKKARTLVDTWKKRVEAEMNAIDSKSGTSQVVSSPKSGAAEISRGTKRNCGGSSEFPRKSSGGPLSTTKSSLLKPLLEETATKSVSSAPGKSKPALSPVSDKDCQPRMSISSTYLVSTPAREEKSSSSSQSHTYSQSMSGKEDARSSSAGSRSVNKISSDTSRHRKSINGCPGPVTSVAQREKGSSRTTSMHRASTSERASGLTSEKAADVPIVEGRSQKLIVKIPNRGRSPALSASGGFCEDSSVMNSRDSSPLFSEKDDHFDRHKKEKNDVHPVSVTSEMSTGSWQSNDLKDLLAGSDEGDVSPTHVNDEYGSSHDNKKTALPSMVAASSDCLEVNKEEKFRGPVAVTTTLPRPSSDGDNVGINLLASVAAGEIPESDLISPADSPVNFTLAENDLDGNESNTRSSPGNICQSRTDAGEKQDHINSASHLAEARKVLDVPPYSSGPEASDTVDKKEGPMLDFDLNVPYGGVLEEMASEVSSHETVTVVDSDLARNGLVGTAPGSSTGRVDIDLNCSVEVDDAEKHLSYSSKSGLDMSLLQDRSTSVSGFLNNEVRRDFDLNNGPNHEDDTSEPLPFIKCDRGSMHPQQAVGCSKMNGAGIGSYSSLFHPGNTYSAIAVPSVLHNSGGKPLQTVGVPKMVSLPSGCTVTPDVGSGSALSASPAVHYPSNLYQYPIFPFGASFPHAPSTLSGGSAPYADTASGGRFFLPGINSQLLGPGGPVSSHNQSPYAYGLPPDANSSITGNDRQWGGQVLDHYASAGGFSMERRDDASLRQLSAFNSRALVEGQAKMHHLASGVKRKEPEGGWDAESFRYMQSARQL